MAKLTKKKATKMLREGKKLTKKQRGYFGVIASGKRPRKIR